MPTEPTPDKMLSIPLALAQAIADYIRQNPSAGPVDVPLQILAALQELKPIAAPDPLPDPDTES